MKRNPISTVVTVVLASIALAGPLMPLSEYDKGLQEKTATNAKQYSVALLMYMCDFDDMAPHRAKPELVQQIVLPYVKTTDIFKTYNPAGGEFLNNVATAAMNQTAMQDPAATPAIYESKTWTDGSRVVGFWDGHAKATSAQAWEKTRLYLIKKNILNGIKYK